MPSWYTDTVQKALGLVGWPKWEEGSRKFSLRGHDELARPFRVSWKGAYSFGGAITDHEARNHISVHFMDWLSSDGRVFNYYSHAPSAPIHRPVVLAWTSVLDGGVEGQGPTRLEALAAAVVAVYEKESKDA